MGNFSICQDLVFTIKDRQSQSESTFSLNVLNFLNVLSDIATSLSPFCISNQKKNDLSIPKGRQLQKGTKSLAVSVLILLKSHIVVHYIYYRVIITCSIMATIKSLLYSLQLISYTQTSFTFSCILLSGILMFFVATHHQSQTVWGQLFHTTKNTERKPFKSNSNVFLTQMNYSLKKRWEYC